MEQSLAQERWNTLLLRIKKGTCVPFIGAGASASHYKTASEIAEMLAKKYRYPFEDSSDLSRVTQYLAIKNRERNIVKEIFLGTYLPPTEAQFDDPSDPYGLLAELPLPLYITTNYDDLILQALRSRKKTPHVAICQWNAGSSSNYKDIFKTKKGYEPTPEEPVVFFLHGYKGDPRSLVLTEDDYLDFLVKLGQKKDNVIPPAIQEAMGQQTLLFVGYGIRDYTFRVLFNTIAAAVSRSDQVTHVSVQLLPSLAEASEEAHSEVEEYLNAYFESQNIFVYWGEARDFCKDFRLKLKESEASDE